MNKPDAIIILGGGTDGTLTPILYTKERLEYFSKFKSKFSNTPIVVSGGYSIWLKKKPKYTEAEVMARFLRQNGFKHVLVEKMSRDTVGNVYFSKQMVKKHGNWKNILVVTTQGHKARSEWLFKKVFGSGSRFDYLEVPSRTGHFGTAKRQAYEKFVVRVYKKIIGHVRSGDDEAIHRILLKKHPAFSNSKEAQKIAKEINDAKQYYLGFVTPHHIKKT